MGFLRSLGCFLSALNWKDRFFNPTRQLLTFSKIYDNKQSVNNLFIIRLTKKKKQLTSPSVWAALARELGLFVFLRQVWLTRTARWCFLFCFFIWFLPLLFTFLFIYFFNFIIQHFICFEIAYIIFFGLIFMGLS